MNRKPGAWIALAVIFAATSFRYIVELSETNGWARPLAIALGMFAAGMFTIRAIVAKRSVEETN
ncbi:MAG: hypothetical protein ACOZB3_02450 [Calditrichota bacterium]